MSDITCGPSRAASDSRRITQQLIRYGRRGCENVCRWTTTLPLAACLPNSRGREADYASVRLKVVPSLGTEALRRRHGGCRRQRNQVYKKYNNGARMGNRLHGKSYVEKSKNIENRPTTIQNKKMKTSSNDTENRIHSARDTERSAASGAQTIAM